MEGSSAAALNLLRAEKKIKKQHGEVERKDRKTERRIRGTAWGIFRMIGGKGKEKNQEQPRAEADDTVECAENLGWYLV
jgi:hypothetical protein